MKQNGYVVLRGQRFSAGTWDTLREALTACAEIVSFLGADKASQKVTHKKLPVVGDIFDKLNA